MKLKLIMFLMFTSMLLAQSDRLTIGILGSPTSGSSDSTVTFYSAGKEWVYIYLVDSLSTSDSVVVETQNPVNDNWTTIGVKDQTEEEYVNILVPGADVDGKLYVVWLMYPNKVRLRKVDVGQLTERISYGIFTKGISE